VEQGMAESMGLNLGDTLKFSVAGELFEGQISSIRSVVWENFRPNFFIIGTQKVLADKPQTWLMSALIKPDQKPYLKTLVQTFPSVTLLDISEVMYRIKGIINRASLALQFFFMFAILAAVIVLLSALNTANKDRQMEIALLQSLGATNRDKLFSQVFEFVLMGAVVGFFAALFSVLTGYIVGAYLFDLSFVFKPEIWLYSISLAVVSITVLGTLFIYRSFNISPMSLLRS
jgi:putative ABC transport system permease protein